jgi:amino acid adenylation domain-containing protein
MAPETNTTLIDPVARFLDAVRRAPDRIAVRDSEGSLTFADLDRRTAELAAALRERGIGRGDRVGVSLPRSTRLVASLLAVWRAGAAYVPLDGSYPDDRLAFMSADADIALLIADEAPGWLPPGTAVLSSAAGAPAGADPAGTPLDPAYLIYTSGSTGKPKGVLATRGGVAALASALEGAEMYTAQPRTVAWNASVSFDASVQQWARVCRGDTVVLLSDEHRKDPARFGDWLDECAVDDVDMTPSHWELLRDRLLPARPDGRVLRLWVGGEPVPRHIWTEIAEADTVEGLNLYGPTECTVDATVAWITGPAPHIGAPLAGIVAYVLDDDLRPAASGEMYLAGAQLTHGYLGRSALTAQRFLADPFGAPGGRMYRTGDQVRRLDTGALEFLGRVDRQVKLRGYRVELGEIESVVRSHPAVARAAVVLRRDPSLGERLVAYHVPVPGADAAGLREHVAGALPDFMVPTAFVALDALPLTPNGKLDEAALPAPEDRAADPDAGLEPAGRFEELIAGVWTEVLGRDRVAANDDFFALGGHSLIALRVAARLKKNLGLAVTIKEVYRHPRLSDLARHVESLHSALAAG